MEGILRYTYKPLFHLMNQDQELYGSVYGSYANLIFEICIETVEVT